MPVGRGIFLIHRGAPSVMDAFYSITQDMQKKSDEIP